jgi:hypothetical protein
LKPIRCVYALNLSPGRRGNITDDRTKTFVEAVPE